MNWILQRCGVYEYVNKQNASQVYQIVGIINFSIVFHQSWTNKTKVNWILQHCGVYEYVNKQNASLVYQIVGRINISMVFHKTKPIFLKNQILQHSGFYESANKWDASQVHQIVRTINVSKIWRRTDLEPWRRQWPGETSFPCHSPCRVVPLPG